MSNFTHPQLEPGLNRVRRVPNSAASPAREPSKLALPPLDGKHPYAPTYVGLFEGSVRDENGGQRNYILYVPSTMQTSGNSMLVFIEGGKKAREVFNNEGWKDILENYAVSAYFIEAPKGWNKNSVGYEMDVGTKVLAEMRSMEFFPCNAVYNYVMGFGDGAWAAAAFAMLNCGALAAFAAMGDIDLDPELIEWIGNMPSDCDAQVKKREVQLPGFIIDGDEDGHPIVEYLREALHSRSEYLYNGFARVWRREPKAGELYINDRQEAEVWYSRRYDLKGMTRQEILGKMTCFVTGYARWADTGNWGIRTAKSPEKMQLKRTDKVIDGFERYWYLFEPTEHRRHPEKKLPLVIGIHGFSCSGAFYAENSLWHAVGEARGFFVAYPNAYPFRKKPVPPTDGRIPIITNPDSARTPAWNSGVEGESGGPDEIEFFRTMLEELKTHYPIDESRIYVSGHSNGSAMAQMLMRYMPETFAGFNPVGAMEQLMDGKAVPQPNGVPRPVWYIMGEFDGAGMGLAPESANYKILNNLCACNKLDYARARFYANGIYNHMLIRGKDHAPLVRFTGVTNWPHTMTPEAALMVWDEFFSRLVRNPDGSVTYLG